MVGVPDVAGAKTADDTPSAIGIPIISAVTAVVFAVDANPAVAGVPVVVAIPTVVSDTAVAGYDMPTVRNTAVYFFLNHIKPSPRFCKIE